MTKEEALYNFWSSFGLPAYEENSVYAMASQGNAPVLPYITYEVVTDSFDGGSTSLTASLWYRDMSWVDITNKKDMISSTIGMGGILKPIDGGQMWIKRRSPFSQSMGDGSDDMIKRIVLNISVEYWTQN